jgi:hypothetical protein
MRSIEKSRRCYLGNLTLNFNRDCPNRGRFVQSIRAIISLSVPHRESPGSACGAGSHESTPQRSSPRFTIPLQTSVSWEE